MRSAFPKKKADASRKIIVAGVGNRLLGDEGIGPCVIDNLSRIRMPSYVDVVDCGCDLLSLTSYMDRPQKIVIVDAIRAGGRPGEIYRFDYSKLAATRHVMHSAHQMRTVDVIQLLKSIYSVLSNTEIIVIGVEPKTLELGSDLSQQVKDSIDAVTNMVIKEASLKEFVGLNRLGQCPEIMI